MDKIVIKVLDKIEENGFEAYIVGGYVRDHFLGIDSYDVDICTNALPKDIKNIFDGVESTCEYGSFSFKTGKYNFDITTYRKEIGYSKRKPIEIEYINNLLDDIKRRDFTINSMCLNSKGELLDLLGGMNDLQKKIIRIIGDPDTRFKDDPLRILRAIRFSVTLSFKIDDVTSNSIKNNASLVSTLSSYRKRNELERIILSKNVLQGLSLIKNYNLDKYLGIKYNEFIPTNDLIGCFSQIEFDDSYIFSKEELKLINNVKAVVKLGKINNSVLYKYGLYICTVAGSIIGIDRLLITNMYNDLPIKNKHDLKITSKDIISILNIKPSKILTDIQNELIENILNGIIINDEEILKQYVLFNKGKWNL